MTHLIQPSGFDSRTGEWVIKSSRGNGYLLTAMLSVRQQVDGVVKATITGQYAEHTLERLQLELEYLSRHTGQDEAKWFKFTIDWEC